MFNQFKTKIIYVKIKVNQMSFNLVNTNEKILLNSKEDFGNHRLLISKFSVAENLMYEGFNTLGKTLFLPHMLLFTHLKILMINYLKLKQKFLKSVL
jgi:hypothetical protein